MSMSNVMDTISIERLHSIEREREEVMGSIEYQNWVAELNVSRSYQNPESKWNAQSMNECYDFRKLKSLGLM